MSGNLKTVWLTSSDTFKTNNGWFVSNFGENLSLAGFPPFPSKNADITVTEFSTTYLNSASIEQVYLLEILPPSKEDPFPCEEKIFTLHQKISPVADENFYYQFLLGDRHDISFSSDFTVLLDTLVEDLYISDKYVRIAYVCLKQDSPFILDSKNKICLSPF